MPTVTVACKLPHGLHLDIPGRGRVTVRGFSVPFGASPENITGGFGLTPGVDKEFFEAWMKRNESLELVQNGFIYASEKIMEAKAEARDKKDEHSGLEPLDPSTPGKDLLPLVKA